MDDDSGLTIREIRKKGYDALVNALGPVDAARYIQSYDKGHGDYTRDRKKWLRNDFDVIVSEIIADRE